MNYNILLLYNASIFNLKTDCTRTCSSGTLNSLCTLCECENSINGTVNVGQLGLVDVEIRAVNQAWSPIAITNSQGL